VLVLEPKAGGADVMVGVPKENPNAARNIYAINSLENQFVIEVCVVSMCYFVRK